MMVSPITLELSLFMTPGQALSVRTGGLPPRGDRRRAPEIGPGGRSFTVLSSPTQGAGDRQRQPALVAKDVAHHLFAEPVEYPERSCRM